MRRITIIILVLCLGLGSWWLWDNSDQVHDLIGQYVENTDFITLEARYTPEQIIEANRKELLADNQRSLEAPELKFHPYLFMDVKYTDDTKKPRESAILWSLVDGEMVLNTDSWEKTHGFEDAINAHASRNDFKILNALAKKNGSISIDQLQKELHLDKDTIQPWIDSALKKHLIIQKGNELQLHLQNPKILVAPQTKISQWLVTKPYNHAQKIGTKYSANQIKNNAKAAFGDDFIIRSSHQVYLPVYSIEIVNPDGSVLTTYWNALNGQRIHPKYIAQK